MANSYDRIAHLYDADMGCRMPFDDVAFYSGVCARSAGAVLEVGCGNGRIALPLRRAGFDVVGIDASVEMLLALARSAAAARLRLPAAAMDMRRLAIRGTFGTVLCPYSVITYAHEVDAGLAAVRGLAAILAPGGRLALDAFVPRPVELGVTTQDYRVPFRGGSLERHKRIEEQGDGTNVIRRFYRIYDASGDEAGSVDTVETIRPYTAADLAAFADASGCTVEEVAYDYGAARTAAPAQFATVVAVKR